MAKFVLRDVTISVNGVALVDHASAVTTDDTADEVEVTSFSTNAYREFVQGLKDATATVTFFQDYALGEVFATLNPLYESGASFPITIRPTSDAISATNPELQMNVKLFSRPALSGSIGEAATVEATFRNADPAGPVYDTTA